MKKILFCLCVLVTVVTVGSILNACIFTACKKECVKCGPLNPNAIEQVTFSLMDKSLQADVKVYKMNVNENYRESAQPGKVDETLFQLCKEYCNSKKIVMDKPEYAFVFYYDYPVTQLATISDENIKGISVYNIEGKKIIHHLFIKNEDSEFFEIENVKVAVGGVMHNHCHFYLENYVFADPDNKSYIIIFSNYSIEIEKDINKYKKVPLRFEVKVSNTKRPRVYCWCAPPCPKIENAGCRTCYGCDPACEPVSCSSVAAYNELPLSRSDERAFFNFDLMYAFRDYVLYNSEKGEEYVDHYYNLSDEWKNKITFPLALQTALFLRDFNPVMEAFVNPNNRLSEIMFTDNLTNSLLELLNQYETITSSDEGKHILNGIRADINSFRNKQLHELLAMLE